MTTNAPATILWSMYLVVAEKQGLAWDKLRGTIQNDILKEYIAEKTYIFPPRPSMKLIVDTLEFGAAYVPQWNPISISGYHIREAGSTALQELAFTLADGFHYVDKCLQRGMVIDEFAPRLSFFYASFTNLLEEVAKFRAARRMWARIARERFGAKDPRSMMLRFHTQTGGSTLTAQQPENNIVRTAIQALAAVLGGTQSLHTNSMDEALALPTERSVRIALRTQQILAHESGVADTVDPLGGSYAVERLTQEIEEAAEAYIARIDDMGGSVNAIGFMQREIQDAAYRYQREVEDKRRIVVGVNDFITEDGTPMGLFAVDPGIGTALRERVQRARSIRQADRAARALDALEAGARGTANLLPLMVDAVEQGVTLGEICDRLRAVFGVHQPSVTF